MASLRAVRGTAPSARARHPSDDRNRGDRLARRRRRLIEEGGRRSQGGLPRRSWRGPLLCRLPPEHTGGVSGVTDLDPVPPTDVKVPVSAGRVRTDTTLFRAVTLARHDDPHGQRRSNACRGELLSDRIEVPSERRCSTSTPGPPSPPHHLVAGSTWPGLAKTHCSDSPPARTASPTRNRAPTWRSRARAMFRRPRGSHGWAATAASAPMGPGMATAAKGVDLALRPFKGYIRVLRPGESPSTGMRSRQVSARPVRRRSPPSAASHPRLDRLRQSPQRRHIAGAGAQ